MQDWLPVQASLSAPAMDDLMLFILQVVIAWFIGAELLLLGFAFAFRKKEGVKAKYIAGNTPGQVGILLGIVVVITAFDFAIDVMNHEVWHENKQWLPVAGEKAPENLGGAVVGKVETLKVVAHQFGWQLTTAGADGQMGTADDVVTNSDAMDGTQHLKLNTYYIVEMTSTDVIHAFSIPEFRFKQDIFPGRIIKGWFMATRAGSYDVSCSQICGMNHGRMGATIVVDDAPQAKPTANASVKSAAVL